MAQTGQTWYRRPSVGQADSHDAIGVVPTDLSGDKWAILTIGLDHQQLSPIACAFARKAEVPATNRRPNVTYGVSATFGWTSWLV